mmetsp:Transcript_58960/g.135203  ORF Transcript_58960/g.135203 Transcript_58960/m.135203 type:complete len:947 (-) Transcript_58960:252-3092(-)
MAPFALHGGAMTTIFALYRVTCASAATLGEASAEALVISGTSARFLRAQSVAATGGFNASWLPGVFGAAPGENTTCFQAKHVNVHEKVAHRGVQNLLIAHRRAWARIDAAGKAAAVFEDDIAYLGPDLELQQDVKRCDREPGCLLWLGVHHEFMTTHALYVTPSAARLLLSITQGICAWPGTDHHLRDACYHRRVNGRKWPGLRCQMPTARSKRKAYFASGYFVQDRVEVVPYLHAQGGKDGAQLVKTPTLAQGLCAYRRSYSGCTCDCQRLPQHLRNLCYRRGRCWPAEEQLDGVDPAFARYATDGSHELLACPRVEQPQRGGMSPPLGSPASLRAGNETAMVRPLVVLDPSSSQAEKPRSWQQGAHLSSPAYMTLVERLSVLAGAALSDPTQADKIFNATGPGNQHVFALRALGLQRGVSMTQLSRASVNFRDEVLGLLNDHLLPYAQQLFGGRKPKLFRLTLSRSVHLAEETVRSRAMLWHWDSLKTNTMKLLIYLTPVPSNQSGCMLALLDKATGLPFRMRKEAPWGDEIRPPPVPRPWLRALLDTGYRPLCITGGTGTIVAFDTNIIHRGSRPAPGLFRDSMLLELTPGPRLGGGGEVAAVSAFGAGNAQPVMTAQALPRRRALEAAGPEALASTGLAFGTNAPGGRRMPVLGFGTANRKASRGAALVRSLLAFLELGGRLIDTAQMYHNHREIGQAVHESMVPREQVWVVSKVNTNRHIKGFVNTARGAMQVVDDCLAELKLSWVDVMLIHLPWENTAQERLAVWKGLLAAKSAGKVRHVGVSNFNRAQIEHLVEATGEWPAVNEIEFHPWVTNQTRALVHWCQLHGITVIGYGSLGGSKNRDKGAASVVQTVAKRYAMSAAQLLLAYSLQRGVAVIPGATSREHIADNLKLLSTSTRPPLMPEDLQSLEASSAPRAFKRWKGLCKDDQGTDGAPCKPAV